MGYSWVGLILVLLGVLGLLHVIAMGVTLAVVLIVLGLLAGGGIYAYGSRRL